MNLAPLEFLTLGQRRPAFGQWSATFWRVVPLWEADSAGAFFPAWVRTPVRLFEE